MIHTDGKRTIAHRAPKPIKIKTPAEQVIAKAEAITRKAAEHEKRAR